LVAVQNQIYKYASDIAFLFAIGSGNNISSFQVSSPSSPLSQSYAHATIAPAPIIEYFLRNASSNLATLKLHSAFLNDASFSLLATSAAAKDLRCLHLDSVNITDKSATLWHKFDALEELVLSEAAWTTKKTFESISKLPNLRKIDLMGNPNMLITDYFVIFGPDGAPALEEFKIQEAAGLDLATIHNLIGTLRLRQNRETLTSIVLGMFPYKSEYAPLFELCPNLKRNMFFFTSLDDVESTGASNIMTHINVRNLVPSLDDAGLERFVRLCPNLEVLSLRQTAIQLEKGSFSSFTNLRSLEFIGTPGTETVTSYPPTLKNIVFDICPLPGAFPSFFGFNNPTLPAPSIDELTTRMLGDLIRDAPDLAEFFAFRTFPLKNKHMEMLFNGLKSARFIETHIDSEPPASEIAQFNCPSSLVKRYEMDRWSQATKGHVPRILSLPYLQDLSLRPFIQTKEVPAETRVLLSHKALPNLRCLQVGFVEQQASLTDVEAEYDHICSLAPSLRHLSVNGNWKSFFSGKLSELHRLQSLQIECVADFAFTPTMQNLWHLELTRLVAPSWLDSTMRFPHLRRLKLDRAAIKQKIVITQEQFPSLEFFDLIGIANIGLDIIDHPKLFSIVLSSIFSFTHVEITGCTNLFSLVVSNFVGCFKTVVQGNANLRQLDLFKCGGVSHAETRIQATSMDRITVVTDEADSEKAVELYKQIVAASEGSLIAGTCTTQYNSGNRSILMDPSPKV
jgi:hypothetical protein